MKNKIFALFILILICLMTLSGCVGFQKEVELVGEEKTVNYDGALDSINKIEVRINLKKELVNVNVVASNDKYIKVTAKESFFDELDYKVLNNEIRINGKRGSLYCGGEIKIEIGFNELRKIDVRNGKGTIDGSAFGNDALIDLSGESKLEISDIDTKEFDLEISGSSIINLSNLKVDEASFEASGASIVSINKIDVLDDIEFEFSGASELNILELNSRNLNFDFSGDSKSNIDNVNISERIDVESSGLCELSFSGISKVLNCELSGDSEIKAFDLILDEAIIEASGDSKILVNVSNKMSVELSGESTLEYKGRPQFNKMETSGKSRIISVE